MWSIILPYAFYPFGVYLTYIYFSTAVPAGPAGRGPDRRLLGVRRLPPGRAAAGDAGRRAGRLLQLRRQLDQLLPAVRDAPARATSTRSRSAWERCSTTSRRSTRRSARSRRPAPASWRWPRCWPSHPCWSSSCSPSASWSPACSPAPPRTDRTRSPLPHDTRRTRPALPCRPAPGGDRAVPARDRCRPRMEPLLMLPVITASVPLLEPPGWALPSARCSTCSTAPGAAFARDFTGPDGRLRYTAGSPPATVWTTSTRCSSTGPSSTCSAAPTTCCPQPSGTGRASPAS